MGKKIRSDRPAEKQGGRTADFLLWFLEKNYWGKFTSCGRFRSFRYALNQRKRPTERRLFCRITETDKLYPCIEIDFHVECKSDQISHRRFLECLRLMTII